MIFLRLLGPVEVSLDGGPPPPELLWRKNLALLIYLARSPRGRTREHLVGLLWPDREDAKARHSVNEALRVLRRVLADGLSTDGETVRIAPGTVHTDVADLDKLDSQMLGLTFLEGFAVPDAPGFDDWVSREREVVQAAQLELLDRRAGGALARGDARVARELAGRALDLDPRHEPSARIAMKARAIEGDRAGSLATFDKLAGALREVGIAPAASTRDLADHIRMDATAPQPAAGAGPEPRWPLAGRAREILEAVIGEWEAACGARRSRLLALLGDPGTGKTRLAQELSARARLAGAIVTRARETGGAARETWAALLRGGLLVPELSGAAPAVLGGLLPLEPDIGVRYPAALRAEPLSLPESLMAAVHVIAETRPVLIVLDDAHRAEPELLGGLVSVVERGTGLPIVVLVAGARGGSVVLDQLVERSGRDVPGAVFTTSVLNETEISGVLAARFPAYSTEQRIRLARRVHADTGGNPFLAMELIRALYDGLNLPAASAAWPSAHRTLEDTRPGDLPESVSAALRLRFRQLSDAAQKTLIAIAVLGGHLPENALAHAVALAPNEVRHALDELEWTQWLVGDARGYQFTMALAREVVVTDMVTGGQQRRLRERMHSGKSA